MAVAEANSSGGRKLPQSTILQEHRGEATRLAISAATYRGVKCPTLRTAEKQPKRVPNGSR